MSIIERALAKAKQQDRAAVEEAEGLAHRPEALAPEDDGLAGVRASSDQEGDASAPRVGGEAGPLPDVEAGPSPGAVGAGLPANTAIEDSQLAGKPAPTEQTLAAASAAEVGAPSTADADAAPEARAEAPVPPLLRVEDLRCAFDVSKPFLNRLLEREPRRWLKAVDGVSFDIPRGQTFALVGESGCGKSTVARLIVGLYEPTRGGLTFDGQDAHAAFKGGNAKAMRRRIQMIFQDPYASLNPRWLVEDIIGEPLKEHGLITDKAALKARVGELLQSVGLSPLDMVKYPHQFSGGQRQRISIARALATKPEFLVCDEPTSALDVSVQAQVLNIMKDLQRERQLTYLFISHNLAVVRHVSDQVGVMYLGRLVELADKHTLFDTPRHPYTRMLLDAIPKMHDTGKARTPVQGEVPNPLNPPPGCAFNPRCPHVNDRCRTERPKLLTIGGIRIACHAVEEGRI